MNTVIQTIHALDVRIYYSLSRYAGNGVISRLARLEEANNLLKGGIFFALFWSHWFTSDAHKERKQRAIIAILVGAVLAIVVARTVAFIVPFNIRPMNDTAVMHPVYAVPIDYNLEQWSSFPSDTAAYFVALAVGLAYLSRRIAIPILLYTSVWICLTRMYLGVHYASDMVVGAAIGVAMVFISLKSGLIQSRVARPIVAVMSSGRQWPYAVAFLVSFEMATVFEGLRSFGNAFMHGIAAGLHLRSLGTDTRSPIGLWGGLIAMLAFFAIAATLARKIRKHL